MLHLHIFIVELTLIQFCIFILGVFLSIYNKKFTLYSILVPSAVLTIFNFYFFFQSNIFTYEILRILYCFGPIILGTIFYFYFSKEDNKFDYIAFNDKSAFLKFNFLAIQRLNLFLIEYFNLKKVIIYQDKYTIDIISTNHTNFKISLNIVYDKIIISYLNESFFYDYDQENETESFKNIINLLKILLNKNLKIKLFSDANKNFLKKEFYLINQNDNEILIEEKKYSNKNLNKINYTIETFSNDFYEHSISQESFKNIFC